MAKADLLQKQSYRESRVSSRRLSLIAKAQFITKAELYCERWISSRKPSLMTNADFFAKVESYRESQVSLQKPRLIAKAESRAKAEFYRDNWILTRYPRSRPSIYQSQGIMGKNNLTSRITLSQKLSFRLSVLCWNNRFQRTKINGDEPYLRDSNFGLFVRLEDEQQTKTNDVPEGCWFPRGSNDLAHRQLMYHLPKSAILHTDVHSLTDVRP